ncbi:Hypothetical predicted protein [Mytilus galloprovincialis]|uniref:COR domain-containing protein n=1 Tax=Mytilus galloprovincialis TaxID=29158 RepID=A0A8B6EJC9_MYTGA|nr:Hypothetical predicted protein [Mytilus galloprovincialis]
MNNTESEKDKNGSLEPRVVLIDSHKDKVEPSERQKIDDACSDRIDSYVNTVSGVAQHHINDDYFISNTVMSVNDDNVFQKIRQAIIVLARNTKTWNKDYPLKFIQLEKLLHVKKKEWPIISMEKMKQISSDWKRMNSSFFLKYHHEIRALVYFEDLSNYIVLDTQWLADAFKCIVTADKLRSGKGRHLGTKAWDDLNNKGILYSQMLKFIIETN